MPQKVSSVPTLQGSVRLPADKSISHRSVMFAALSEEKSHIANFSAAADPHSTLQCLRKLGVSCQQKENKVVVVGVGRDGLQAPKEALDCQNSGTTMRLLSGIAGGAGIACTLTGDESLSGRTMKRIIEPLRSMNIRITGRENNFAPLKIKANASVHPIQFELPIPSAQLKSCVLLAGLFGDEPTTVIETVTSRDHTERLLQLPITYSNGKKQIRADKRCPIPAQNYRIPGDFSAAAYWLVAGAVHSDASIMLPGVGVNETRTGALNILEQMGANIIMKNERTEGVEPVADMQVASSVLDPIDIDAGMVPNCIDELPILAVAMLFADGQSEISGAEELRHKETDRLAAMADILNTAGARFTEKEDGFIIQGSPDFTPQEGTFKSYGDHRIAMSAAVLALMGQDSSQIMEGGCTAISYPNFWDDLNALAG